MSSLQLDEKSCPVCQQPGIKICSGCSNQSYCSPLHQKQHWNQHKGDCRPFIIKRNEKYGRYLVAARDLPEGAIIMSEPPLAVGPKRSTFPVCLGCHKKLTEIMYRCSKCSFPLCNKDCENNQTHSTQECPIFSSKVKIGERIISRDQIYPAYESIYPLRCVLLKKRDPDKWARLNTMEHLTEARRNFTDVWNRGEGNVVKFLKEFLGVDEDADDIRHCMGFIDVNSFEVKGFGGVEMCALYPEAALMSHDCTPNTHHATTAHPHNIMIVRTSKAIKKHSIISASYADVFMPTIQRREFLLRTKYFTCLCNRCTDPTEFGSYYSSIKCISCLNGNLLIDTTNYLTGEDWCFICDNCGANVDQEKYDSVVSKISRELEVLEGSGVGPRVDKVLKKMGNRVGRSCWLIFNVLKHAVGNGGDPSRMISVCKEILSVMSKIQPGLSRDRAVLLYTLYECEFNSTKEIKDPVKRIEELKRIVNYLEEVKLTLELDRLILDHPVLALKVNEAINSCLNAMK